MSGSLDDIRAGLATVAELLDSAAQHTAGAAAKIDEAVAMLARLSADHSESVLPAELQRAADEVQQGLALIRGGELAVSDIEARL